MNIITLGSCSSANCSIVNIGGNNFIIDTGKIKAAIIKEYLSKIDSKKCGAIFITHAHTDHLSKNTFKVSNELSCPIYIRAETLQAAERKLRKYIQNHPAELIKTFTELEFNISNIKVKAIDVPHRGMGTDASGLSVSYFFQNINVPEESIFFGTDIGEVSDEVQEYINLSEVLFIESNHDVELVENSPRYYKHKNWLISSRGHLSNVQTTEVIEKALIYRKRPYEKIILSHLSRNCNSPERAVRTLYNRIKKYNQPYESIIVAPTKGQLYINCN